uniref:Uncharacterized protein n=1 Tax=Oryza brachyantha TaxID=4533 RepID=J3MFG6_ORYBR
MPMIFKFLYFVYRSMQLPPYILFLWKIDFMNHELLPHPTVGQLLHTRSSICYKASSTACHIIIFYEPLD